MKIEPDILCEIVRAAGKEILEVYAGEITVESKDDKSPLTLADRRANALITGWLGDRWPEIPIISEENRTVPFSARRGWRECWLVDPLDGTKEFIKRNGEFTVNIALVRDGRPVVGVVYQPTTGDAYYGEDGEPSRKVDARGAVTRLVGGPHYSECSTVRVIASRSHLSPEVEGFVAGLQAEGREVELVSAGSSLKFCLVAAGTADVYPRLGPTMEWDTAAAQCVAAGAGRRTLAWNGRKPLSYNKTELLNPWFTVE